MPRFRSMIYAIYLSDWDSRDELAEVITYSGLQAWRKNQTFSGMANRQNPIRFAK